MRKAQFDHCAANDPFINNTTRPQDVFQGCAPQEDYSNKATGR